MSYKWQNMPPDFKKNGRKKTINTRLPWLPIPFPIPNPIPHPYPCLLSLPRPVKVPSGDSRHAPRLFPPSGAGVGDVAVLVPGWRRRDRQEPRHLLRHGLAHHQRRRLLQVLWLSFCCCWGWEEKGKFRMSCFVIILYNWGFGAEVVF